MTEPFTYTEKQMAAIAYVGFLLLSLVFMIYAGKALMIIDRMAHEEEQ